MKYKNRSALKVNHLKTSYKLEIYKIFNAIKKPFLSFCSLNNKCVVEHILTFYELTCFYRNEEDGEKRCKKWKEEIGPNDS